MTTPVCEMLGIEQPIVQAPMAAIPGLAAAVKRPEPGKSFELPVMGTFEVSGGKISAWRDYFDMNRFTSRIG